MELKNWGTGIQNEQLGHGMKAELKNEYSDSKDLRMYDLGLWNHEQHEKTDNLILTRSHPSTPAEEYQNKLTFFKKENFR